MNSFLLKNLIEKHTINGDHIRIDDSSEVLDLTAHLIESDADADFQCMVEQLRESDELTEFLMSVVRRGVADQVMTNLALEELAQRNLKETIDRLLRAGK